MAKMWSSYALTVVIAAALTLSLCDAVGYDLPRKIESHIASSSETVRSHRRSRRSVAEFTKEQRQEVVDAINTTSARPCWDLPLTLREEAATLRLP